MDLHGGSGDGSSDRYLKYFKLRYPDRCVPNYKRDTYCQCQDRICFPKYQNACLCSQRTWENYYIENIFTKEAKVIGHCCVRRFFSKCDQLCLVCHSNPRNNDTYYCSTCRKYNAIDPKVARQKEEDYLKRMCAEIEEDFEHPPLSRPLKGRKGIIERVDCRYERPHRYPPGGERRNGRGEGAAP